MPDKKKPAPKKRSIIMDTLFGREDDPETADVDESKSKSLLEGAKNILFGKKALEEAAKTPEERKKSKK